MAEPPFDAGTENVIVASPLPRVAVPIVGAPGVVAGVTELLVADAEPVPTAFVAVTVKVYVVPLVSPVITIGELPPVAVCPPLEVTVYEVIAEPPLEIGAENVIVASPLPCVAVPIVGASGTVAGTTELLVAEEIPVPCALVAVTVNVYETPLVRPVTVIGDDPPVPVCPPLDVTVYDVTADPPTFAGGVKVIVACPFPLTATMFVGESGAY